MRFTVEKITVKSKTLVTKLSRLQKLAIWALNIEPVERYSIVLTIKLFKSVNIGDILILSHGMESFRVVAKEPNSECCYTIIQNEESPLTEAEIKYVKCSGEGVVLGRPAPEPFFKRDRTLS